MAMTVAAVLAWCLVMEVATEMSSPTQTSGVFQPCTGLTWFCKSYLPTFSG